MIVEKAYAKINLGLEVIRKREDNFHELAMVMTTISLSDELFFLLDEKGHINIDCEKMSHIPFEANLIYKAAKMLQERFNVTKGALIRVTKNIPEQSGLGGGSADAAATLRGLNELWELGLSLDELAILGAEIGSDVPFCIYNKTAKVTGRGEILEFIDDVPYLNLILVFPQFKASTKDVFNNFKIHYRNKGKLEKLIKAISSKDIGEISDNLFNDLEYSFYFKDINKLKSELVVAGAKAALMTGSGSAIYAICLNEKDAQRVNNRFIQANRNITTMFVQTRSSIKYTWSGQVRQQIKYKTLDQVTIKAYGYVSLAYQSLGNGYLTIESPISAHSEVVVEKISHKVSEVFLNEYLEVNKLTEYIEKLVNKLDYGLRIKIKEGYHAGFDIVNYENYLANVIKALESFGENSEELFNLFDNRVRAYKEENTFSYDSRTDELKILENIPYAHLLFVDLGLKNYKNPRYTKQATIDERYSEIIEGLEEHNYYRIISNLFNSLTRFEINNIGRYIKLNINKVMEDCLKYGAQGVILSVDGKKLICFTRQEKYIKPLVNILKNFHNLRKTLSVRLKSNVAHKFIESKVLKALEPIEIQQYKTIEIEEQIYDRAQIAEIFEKEINKASYEETIDYSNLDFEDTTNPFTGEEIKEQVVVRAKPKKEPLARETKGDLEGMLHIHSGGSLFKQYDFEDIAKYFQNYFDNKKIQFDINGEIETVIFKTDSLAHLIGIHKAYPENDEYKGSKGFKKLINGDITHAQLKKAVEKKVFDQINQRAQSLILIFNELYHGRDDNLICFEKEHLIKQDSFLQEKLKFGITRAIAGNVFHTRNVLGVGYEEESNFNYFMTSYIWGAQAELGKKEGFRIKIVK